VSARQICNAALPLRPLIHKTLLPTMIASRVYVCVLRRCARACMRACVRVRVRVCTCVRVRAWNAAAHAAYTSILSASGWFLAANLRIIGGITISIRALPDSTHASRAGNGVNSQNQLFKAQFLCSQVSYIRKEKIKRNFGHFVLLINDRVQFNNLFPRFCLATSRSSKTACSLCIERINYSIWKNGFLNYDSYSFVKNRLSEVRMYACVVDDAEGSSRAK